MTLLARKWLIVAMVLGIVGVAHIMAIAAWLQESGGLDLARDIQREFLTGTAITILVALLILLVPAGAACPALSTRCDVAATPALPAATAPPAAADGEKGRVDLDRTIKLEFHGARPAAPTTARA